MCRSRGAYDHRVEDAVRFRRRGGRRQKTVRCCRAKWDAYRVCYLRVPEGLIIELAEKLASE